MRTTGSSLTLPLLHQDPWQDEPVPKLVTRRRHIARLGAFLEPGHQLPRVRRNRESVQWCAQPAWIRATTQLRRLALSGPSIRMKRHESVMSIVTNGTCLLWITRNKQKRDSGMTKQLIHFQGPL